MFEAIFTAKHHDRDVNNAPDLARSRGICILISSTDDAPSRVSSEVSEFTSGTCRPQRLNSPLSGMSRYGPNLTPNPAPTGSRFGNKGRTSRGRREPSGVFTLFQPAQVQQFREAFSLIDQDGDGTVSEEDLKRIFASLGKLEPPPQRPTVEPELPLLSLSLSLSLSNLVAARYCFRDVGWPDDFRRSWYYGKPFRL